MAVSPELHLLARLLNGKAPISTPMARKLERRGVLDAPSRGLLTSKTGPRDPGQ